MADVSRPNPHGQGSPRPIGQVYSRTPINFFPEGDAPVAAYGAIQKEFKGESDRAAAILGGAVIEWRIRQTVEFRLCHSGQVDADGKYIPNDLKKKEVSVLLGNDREDILPNLSFKDQTRLAFCLGLIGPIAFQDCSLIAKIRNRFAHQFHIKTFLGDEVVSRLCRKLKSPELQAQVGRGFTVTDPATIDHTNEMMRQRYIDTVNCLYLMPYMAATHFAYTLPAVDQTTSIELETTSSSVVTTDGKTTRTDEPIALRPVRIFW